MRRPIAALLTLLAAVAVGCGSNNQPSTDFSGAEEDVAQVVEDLQSAAQEEETSRICSDILAADVARSLGNRCERTIQTAIDDTDVFEVSAEDVTIRGNQATVRVVTGRDGDRREQLQLVREGGDWRIAEFGGDVR